MSAVQCSKNKEYLKYHVPFNIYFLIKNLKFKTATNSTQKKKRSTKSSSPVSTVDCAEKRNSLTKIFFLFLKGDEITIPQSQLFVQSLHSRPRTLHLIFRKKLQREHGEIIIPTTTAAATATYKDANITSLQKKSFILFFWISSPYKALHVCISSSLATFNLEKIK